MSCIFLQVHTHFGEQGKDLRIIFKNYPKPQRLHLSPLIDVFDNLRNIPQMCLKAII